MKAATAPKTADPQIALASFMSLTDLHLQKLADTLQLQAQASAAQSQQWGRIRPLLAQLRPINAAALLWFAKSDGAYWTLERGRQTANLASRPYFPRLLAGHTVLGDLVISKATKRASAIVAVPIIERGAVVGALGASVYLDKLSAQIRTEMQIPQNVIFFSFDKNAVVGVNWDNSLIFLQPRTLSPDLDRAFGAMLAHTHGTQTYTFRGRPRTVTYRRSKLTGWWYAMGRAQP